VIDALIASQVQVQVSTNDDDDDTEQEPEKLNITHFSVTFQPESLSLMVDETIGPDQVCFCQSFIPTWLNYASYSIRFTWEFLGEIFV